MRLQSDVTVNYANQIKTVAVTYNHLEVDSKYNTYKYEGLPIGPISTVSKDVINAVSYTHLTHNIINLSDSEDLVTVMWANESFDPEHPDTFFEKV